MADIRTRCNGQLPLPQHRLLGRDHDPNSIGHHDQWFLSPYNPSPRSHWGSRPLSMSYLWLWTWLHLRNKSLLSWTQTPVCVLSGFDVRRQTDAFQSGNRKIKATQGRERVLPSLCQTFQGMSGLVLYHCFLSLSLLATKVYTFCSSERARTFTFCTFLSYEDSHRTCDVVT